MKELFPNVSDCFHVVREICLALSFLITCHSKNHKKDGIKLLNQVTLAQSFKNVFTHIGLSRICMPQIQVVTCRLTCTVSTHLTS